MKRQWWKAYYSHVYLTTHEKQILDLFDSVDTFMLCVPEMWKYNMKKLTIKQSISLMLQQPKDDMELWG